MILSVLKASGYTVFLIVEGTVKYFGKYIAKDEVFLFF